MTKKSDLIYGRHGGLMAVRITEEQANMMRERQSQPCPACEFEALEKIHAVEKQIDFTSALRTVCIGAPSE